jgi:hypothetical protein
MLGSRVAVGAIQKAQEKERRSHLFVSLLSAGQNTVVTIVVIKRLL